MFLLWPLQGLAVIEQAKADARLMDKHLQIELGYKRASDWTKAKQNSAGHPLSLHKVLERAPAIFLRCFAYAILDALDADDRERGEIERAIRVLQRLTRPKHMAKAELSAVATEEGVA